MPSLSLKAPFSAAADIAAFTVAIFTDGCRHAAADFIFEISARRHFMMMTLALLR